MVLLTVQDAVRHASDYRSHNGWKDRLGEIGSDSDSLYCARSVISKKHAASMLIPIYPQPR